MNLLGKSNISKNNLLGTDINNNNNTDLYEIEELKYFILNDILLKILNNIDSIDFDSYKNIINITMNKLKLLMNNNTHLIEYYIMLDLSLKYIDVYNSKTQIIENNIPNNNTNDINNINEFSVMLSSVQLKPEVEIYKLIFNNKYNNTPIFDEIIETIQGLMLNHSISEIQNILINKY